MDKIEVLKSENEYLRILANQDSLTGLFNRRAMEETVNRLMESGIQGVFIMLDLDVFKLINDEYGHSMGDRILWELGTLFTYIFFKKDVIGRIGGDEFAVFMAGDHEREFVRSKVKGLQKRFGQAGLECGVKRKLSFTAGAVFTNPGDTYQMIYERADCAMQNGKLDGKNRLCFYESSMEPLIPKTEDASGKSFYMADMKCIIQELKEPRSPEGAYCQDYHAFLSIYRLFERLLGRFGIKCHIILISMTDSSGTYVNLRELESLMDALRQSICFSLRASDIYTQYSSCQFLTMTPGADQKDMDIITSRIQQAFREKLSNRTDIMLSYSFYPLEAIVSNRHRCADVGEEKG